MSGTGCDPAPGQGPDPHLGWGAGVTPAVKPAVTPAQAASLMDLAASGGADAAITALEDLLGRLRPAQQARASLARLDPGLLRRALIYRTRARARVQSGEQDPDRPAGRWADRS